MLTATAAEKVELTATATIDVATTVMTPVGFKNLYLCCTTHATQCQACHEPIDQCEYDPLPIMPPRRSDVVSDARGPHLVLINDVLTAINAATARAQGEEATALQRAEEGMEEQSEEGTTVEVRPSR